MLIFLLVLILHIMACCPLFSWESRFGALSEQLKMRMFSRAHLRRCRLHYKTTTLIASDLSKSTLKIGVEMRDLRSNGKSAPRNIQGIMNSSWIVKSWLITCWKRNQLCCLIHTVALFRVKTIFTVGMNWSIRILRGMGVQPLKYFLE